MHNEVWVLGATGRTGRAVARRLHERGIPLVLVGRDRERLESVRAELGGALRLRAGTLDAALAALTEDAPGVVVNTVGPFTTTAREVARACPPGTHYVDVANEFPAVERVLALDREAAAANQVFVTGAGFGVLATESVLLRLCAGQPPPTRVRVDALASVATETGSFGSALAATIVGILSIGGREVRGGRLVRSRLAADFIHLTTPDSEVLATASGPSGELLAAWRASNAANVVAASSYAPPSALVRLAIPAVAMIFRIPGISSFASRTLARLPVQAQDRPRPHSWAHARVEWASGTVCEGWLRAGDGMDFTAGVAAEVTYRLLKGEGRPGSYTPGALFGSKLAEAVGGEFILDQETCEDGRIGVHRETAPR